MARKPQSEKRQSESERLAQRTASRSPERGPYEEHLANLGEGAEYEEGWEDYNFFGQKRRPRQDQSSDPGGEEATDSEPSKGSDK